MGIGKWLLGGAVGTAVEATKDISDVVDKFIETPDEKREWEKIQAKMMENQNVVQTKLNEINARNPSIFIAGWRPFIGWTCGISIAFIFLVNPILQWVTNKPGPVFPTELLLSLTLSMIGVAGLRTVEKFKGVAR